MQDNFEFTLMSLEFRFDSELALRVNCSFVTTWFIPPCVLKNQINIISFGCKFYPLTHNFIESENSVVLDQKHLRLFIKTT